MRKIWSLIFAVAVISAFIAGCGGGGGTGVHRITGLMPERVVATFHDYAKDQKLAEAALYVSPTSLTAIRGVGNYLTKDLGLTDVVGSNLLSVKLMGESGDFAVVMATLQDGLNSTKISVKTIGLEKINGEWYIVDSNTIFQDAKYKLLQDLINKAL